MSTGSKSILVIGGTGTQGSKVVRLLAEKGHGVRVLTRNIESDVAKDVASLGVELFAGDMDDLNSLKKAMDGAYGVYFIGIGREDPSTEINRGSNIVDASKTSNVRHIVFSGVSGGNRSIGVPHFETKGAIEGIIKNGDIDYTILRPVSFTDNFNRNRDAIKNGRLSGILSPDRNQWFIAVQNIADFAVAAFENPERFSGKEIDLAGDVMTLPEVAQVFAESLGIEVNYNHIPEDQRDRVPAPMKTMNEFYEREGYLVDVDRLKMDWDIPGMSVKDWILQEPGWLD